MKKSLKVIATAIYFVVSLLACLVALALIVGEPIDGCTLVEEFGLFFGKLIAILAGAFTLMAVFGGYELLVKGGIIYGISE